MAEPLSTRRREALFAAFVECPSIEHVSRKCRVHHATAKKYQRLDKWGERLESVRRKSREVVDYDLSTAMAESLGMVRLFKDKLRTVIEQQEFDPGKVTIQDLEKLIKLEAFILGGVESRVEVKGQLSTWSDEELRKYAEYGERPKEQG